MKLREFVANSLPRVRGRKKKGQTTTSNPQASISAAATAAAAAAAVATSHTNASSCSGGEQTSPDVLKAASPKSGRQEGSWFSFSESRFSFLEKLVGKDSPVKRLLETKDRRVAPKGDKRLEDKLRSSPRFCPTSATEPSSPSGGPRVRSPPLGEKPVFHSQHASPVSLCWAARERHSDWDCSSLHNAGYGGHPDSLTSFHSTPGSQRGPRSRSRIRTNPWLPSPRPSPYSVRSLSSPCTSSRSPSPSSSPAPPSSSDSTSPLTSFSSDVSTKRESQLQRHRRHRRHHSEVKASELTRLVVFDPPLTDTEQYYSTLDSGIGDTAASSGEKDRHKVAASRKHRSSKRRSVERDLEVVKSLASSSPKSKPKFRSKNRATHQPSSKALIANRDSKFWDSDSSSRSPPCRSLHASKDSLHFDNFHSDGYSISNRSPRLPGTPREVVPAFFHGDFLCGADSVDLCAVSGSHKSSVLSLCDDICIITSNIEQLAQNISSEYEEGLEVSTQSLLDNSKQDPEQVSRKELHDLDLENGPITHKLNPELCSALDYHSFAGPLQCTLLRAEERERGCEAQNDTSTDTPNTDLSSYEDTSTVDVAVQTDFADDEEEDVSLSDWLASTESGSDWVTSNGSGSDWPTSGGSDWQTGEGSGCATEEDEERKKEVEEEEEEERSLWVVEGSRLWMVPDIMQNSTDTGYSSLSRDGRVVTDDNNNNNNNHNNNSSHTVSHVEDSSDSSSATTTTTTEDKMSKTSDSDLTKSEPPSHPSSSDLTPSGAIPKSSEGQKLFCTGPPHSAASRPCAEACAQRLSCKLQFSIMGGECHCSRSTVPCGKDKPLPPTRPRAKSDHCLDEVEFFIGRKGKALQSTAQRASREAGGRHSDYDHVVPYPYDVRRFSDVDLPCDQREGSVSPCFYDSLPSTSEEAEACSRLCTAPLTSTPLFQRGEAEEDEEDDFYSLFPANSMTPDRRDVTVHAKASGSAEGRGQSGQASSLALAPFRSRLSLRALEDLPCTGRPLQEVRASLEKEVEVLRQGRRLVSRKIREAREEEMVRQQQKLRFQRLLDIHRKRILLETLQDLRQRLESQSMRLQASYSSVLHLQKRGV